MDLVGPLPAAECGVTYILIMVDQATRWPEAVVLSSITAAACVDAFISACIFRYSVLDLLISDRRVQFTSEL